MKKVGFLAIVGFLGLAFITSSSIPAYAEDINPAPAYGTEKKAGMEDAAVDAEKAESNKAREAKRAELKKARESDKSAERMKAGKAKAAKQAEMEKKAKGLTSFLFLMQQLR